MAAKYWHLKIFKWNQIEQNN